MTITITLEEEMLPHIAYEKDGAKRDFYTDHNTFFEFVQANYYKTKAVKNKFEQPIFETPALPPNTVKYMALPDGKVVLFMERKGFISDVNYHGTIYNNVPYPSLLFQFVFSPNPEKDTYDMKTKKCFAFKDKVLRDTTRLYQFPFSHVQGDGSMCYYAFNEIVDLAQMTSFIDTWLRTETTDHYYAAGRTNQWGWSLREVFTKTQGQPFFDYSKLVETKYTVKTLVDNLVKQYFPNL